ncbi:hypothetical protein Tco_0881500 [Tanacetum coccineum]
MAEHHARGVKILEERQNTLPYLDVVLKSYGMSSQLTDYGFEFNKISLYCDNKSAIALCYTSEPKTTKTPNPEWFKQPPRPPTPDLEWNKCHVVLDQPEHPWFNHLVFAIKVPLTFNDLMATPIDFSKYVLNQLKIDNMTQDILLGHTYDLLKGTCTSSIELEYNFQECFNALTNKLDWNNPEGDRYPFDLSKPLPLQGRPGHLTVAADYFFNNDLEYLKSSDPDRTATESIKEKSNEAKVKHGIDVIETINIELEHKVSKLLKKNKTLKRHYKELSDSIKTTRAKTIEHTTSLIAQNVEFKAQL